MDLGASVAVAATLPGPAAAVTERRIVGMHLEQLFDPAAAGGDARVLLNLADGPWVARFEHLDRDDTGHRTWVGIIEGIDHSHVGFTEREGVVAGLIDAVSGTYQLRTITPGVYILERVDTTKLGRELEPLMPAAVADAPHAAAPATGVWDDANSIDVLVLYTPNARVAAGGTSQIQALASQTISDSNTIFSRSGINPRFRLVGTMEFALTEASSMSTDLGGVTNSPMARSLRDQSKADLVALLVSSPDPNTCGIAWLLSSLGNTSFSAYSVSDIACVAQYTPTHEMGHNMGSHHAPEDGASGALFSYSYGYKDPARGFRTVMAYSCSNVSCPRIANFSNPGITVNGGVTGTASQNNALSINNAASTVANFRQSGTTTPTPTVPSAPTALRSTVSGSNVTVSWNASTDEADLAAGSARAASAATGYILQTGTASGQSNLFNASVGNVTTVSGALAAGTYYWRVIASNSAGNSPPSAEARFTVGSACALPAPGAPVNFTFSRNGRTITLSWIASGAGGPPTSFILEAGSAPSRSDLHNASTGTSATTLVVQAPPGSYWVRIRAQNACGTSGASNELNIVVP